MRRPRSNPPMQAKPGSAVDILHKIVSIDEGLRALPPIGTLRLWQTQLEFYSRVNRESEFSIKTNTQIGEGLQWIRAKIGVDSL